MASITSFVSTAGLGREGLANQGILVPKGNKANVGIQALKERQVDGATGANMDLRGHRDAPDTLELRDARTPWTPWANGVNMDLPGHLDTSGLRVAQDNPGTADNEDIEATMGLPGRQVNQVLLAQEGLRGRPDNRELQERQGLKVCEADQASRASVVLRGH